MQSWKKISDYIELKKLEKKDVESLFHTTVSIVNKRPAKKFKHKKLPQKYKNNWYLKQETEIGDAIREVIAQELFRLFIPNQPKTRLVEQSGGSKEAVAVKEVPGYRCWEKMDKTELNQKIKDGTYYGLGEILVIAMLVNETDLKEGNLCLDDNNQIIKLDGDWTFTKLSGEFLNKSHDITEEDIRALPYIKNYFSNHWLDYIRNGKMKSDSVIIDKEMPTLKIFRDEVNRAILKTLIVPDLLLRNFIRHYATRSETYEHYNEILSRRAQLKRAALKNESFCEYLTTPASQLDLQSYLRYLREFKTTGKNVINVPMYDNAIHAQYGRLVNTAKNNLHYHLVNEAEKKQESFISSAYAFFAKQLPSNDVTPESSLTSQCRAS